MISKISPGPWKGVGAYSIFDSEDCEICRTSEPDAAVSTCNYAASIEGVIMPPEVKDSAIEWLSKFHKYYDNVMVALPKEDDNDL